MELNDRVVVVTGGARGIGFALAEAFLGAGARAVAIADLESPTLVEAAERLGERARAHVVDVADPAALEHLVADVEREHGPIDLFVSNAGIGSGAGIDATPEQWDQIWRVNVLAHVYGARAVLPSMLARGEGYLLSTASAAGLLTQIGDLPYSATKHAAVAVAEWLAITYGSQGIKVSCLCPQGVRTDMVVQNTGHSSIDTVVSQGLLEPVDVARATVAGLISEDFLILPHPEVAEYYRRRAADTDRWLEGMRRLQARILGALGPLDPPSGS